MSIHIESVYPSVGEAELASFEHDHGVAIPSAYRSFLALHNGGRPTPDCFEWTDGRGKYREMIDSLLAVHAGRSGMLDTFAVVLPIYAGRYPEDLFPIATTVGSDLVLMGRDATTQEGRVFFWDHNWEADDGKPSHENVHLVAGTFAQFVSQLFEEPAT